MALRVLLADENVTIKKVIQLSLQDYAVTVKSVNLGVDVLDVARSFQPDIVFADILLQKRSGYEVCSDFKQDPQLHQIPIILMWSGFMELDRQRFQQCGANGEIEKPFNKEALRSVIAHFVPKTQGNDLGQYLTSPDIPVISSDDLPTNAEEAPGMTNSFPGIPEVNSIPTIVQHELGEPAKHELGEPAKHGPGEPAKHELGSPDGSISPQPSPPSQPPSQPQQTISGINFGGPGIPASQANPPPTQPTNLHAVPQTSATASSSERAQPGYDLTPTPIPFQSGEQINEAPSPAAESALTPVPSSSSDLPSNLEDLPDLPDLPPELPDDFVNQPLSAMTPSQPPTHPSSPPVKKSLKDAFGSPNQGQQFQSASTPATPLHSQPSESSSEGSGWNMDSFDDINDFSSDAHLIEDNDADEFSMAPAPKISLGSPPKNTDPAISPNQNAVASESASLQSLANKTPNQGASSAPQPPSVPTESMYIETPTAAEFQADEVWVQEDLSAFKLDVPEDMDSAANNKFDPEVTVNFEAGDEEVSLDSFVRSDAPGTAFESVEINQQEMNEQDLAAGDLTQKEAYRKETAPQNTPQAQNTFNTNLSEDQLEKLMKNQSREVLESVAWKILPDLAEKIVREEVQKLIKEAENHF